MIDLQEMLRRAIEKTGDLPVGAEYEVKDLFLGILNWKDDLERGEKTQLGNLYSNAFSCGNIPNVVRVEVKRGKANRYRKI